MKKTAHEFKGGWGKIIIEAPTQKAAKNALQSFKNKILYLTVHKQAFDAMVTGEKQKEFRKPTKWILSRLYKKDGELKQFDFVKISNGYQKNSPYFIAEFKGLEVNEIHNFLYYLDGLEVEIFPGDLVLLIGKIIERKHCV